MKKRKAATKAQALSAAVNWVMEINSMIAAIRASISEVEREIRNDESSFVGIINPTDLSHLSLSISFAESEAAMLYPLNPNGIKPPSLFSAPTGKG